MDDMAIKKKNTYATVMINQKTHKIVSILPTRDCEEVANWLCSFPNLILVSRDGSNIYKTAINTANNEIIQVSDRFHLIKNLSNFCKLEIGKLFNGRILVDEIELEYEQKIMVKDKYFKCKSLIDNGMLISQACLEAKIDIRNFKKINGFNEDEFNNYFASKSINTIKANENRERKRKNAEKIKELHSKGVTIRKIASIMGKKVLII